MIKDIIIHSGTKNPESGGSATAGPQGNSATAVPQKAAATAGGRHIGCGPSLPPAVQKVFSPRAWPDGASGQLPNRFKEKLASKSKRRLVETAHSKSGEWQCSDFFLLYLSALLFV
jgi:hypothetical protein